MAAEAADLLHPIFRAAARRHGERVAVEVPPGSGRPGRVRLRYAELARRAEALAGRLGPHVQADSIVAVLLGRADVDLYVAQLAVLGAGGAFTCLDPRSPDAQLAAVLADARPVTVLTDAPGRARLAAIGRAGPAVFEIRGGGPAPGAGAGDGLVAGCPLGAGGAPVQPTDLAYVVYTSGTTGRPKGVMIEHRSIANLVRSDVETFGLGPEDRVAQCSSPAYDSSIEETWLAFAAGATLVVLDDEVVRSGPDLVGWLQRERISVLCPPPTLLRAMGCEDPAAALPGLRLLYVGGEALAPDLADRWAVGRRMVNGYGPTECTVTVTRGLVRPQEPVTIGRPVTGHRAWVLDESLSEVSDGQAGELCLAGIGLARGYLGQAELTAEQFPTHARFGRIYRTGDLVRRRPDGELEYLGRLDGQVKLRGHRVELGAIETRLAACPGVRAAACRVQGSGDRQVLVAHIVPEVVAAPPAPEALVAALRQSLPEHMVPRRFGLLDGLPTTAGGKLDRQALPEVADTGPRARRGATGPRDTLEAAVVAAFRQALGLDEAISTDDDFFLDLGGDSLSAVRVVVRLRESPETRHVAVRDLYDRRTAAALAHHLRATRPADSAPAPPLPSAPPAGSPLWSTVVQGLWLLLFLVLAAASAYVLAFALLPWLLHELGGVAVLLLAPLLGVAGLLLYVPFAVALAVGAKRLLVGQYRPQRAPVWGRFYTRHWLTVQTARLIPWGLLAGTVFLPLVLRALGARVGRRVHIHRGVDLRQGGWDLLTLGDDVTLCRDAALSPVELEHGQLVVGPINVGDRATIEVRAGLSPHTDVASDARLTALSWLPPGGHIPAGEEWDGVPAVRAGAVSPPPAAAPGRELSPSWHGGLMVLAQCGRLLLAALPWSLLAVGWLLLAGSSAAAGTLTAVAALVLLPVVALPLSLLFEALALRWSGAVPAGVISRWSPAAIRVWFKMGTVEAAGGQLSGSLFWPGWLRLAGMRIGRGCEISTIIDVLPETVTIGAESFFADGIYFCGPRWDRGRITIAPTEIGRDTFLGNHCLIGAGHRWPDGLFVGVSTVADAARARAGSAWFGHPPMALPRREVVAVDRRLTHEPDRLRFTTRLFWELLRFGLPVLPLTVALGWYGLVAWAAQHVGPVALVGVVVPALTLVALAMPCLATVVLKWLLLGRVRPGQHPFWSCWCGRWDFVYMAWSHWAAGTLAWLEGTLFLNAFLRLTGMRIGRRVVLGPGFAQVVDPDMLHFEDGATVACQLQAHSFEDRVLKLDRLHIRRDASVGRHTVVFYGADIGLAATVGPHGVVMKHDVLAAGGRYAGCPTRAVLADAGPAGATAGQGLWYDGAAGLVRDGESAARPITAHRARRRTPGR
jgi:non-ribosomal peptide synthetase-like protein